jgi:hypothetical protein
MIAMQKNSLVLSFLKGSHESIKKDYPHVEIIRAVGDLYNNEPNGLYADLLATEADEEKIRNDERFKDVFRVGMLHVSNKK